MWLLSKKKWMLNKDGFVPAGCAVQKRIRGWRRDYRVKPGNDRFGGGLLAKKNWIEKGMRGQTGYGKLADFFYYRTKKS